MIEQRKHARLGVSVAVDFHSGHNFFKGRTQDVSLGGLFIATEVPLPVGTVIEVTMDMTTGVKPQLFRASADVMWVKTAPDGATQGVGVRFKALSTSAQRAFEVFMALRKPLYLDANDPSPLGLSRVPRPELRGSDPAR
jgi:uncharacterized protein (TIGR02266 family)